jgi:hypothetical protein
MHRQGALGRKVSVFIKEDFHKKLRACFAN